MKKIILIILMILSLSCKKSNDNIHFKKDFSANQYINVGIYVYDYPFGYLSNGNIGGFDYDLVNEISKISGSNMIFFLCVLKNLCPL